MQQFNPYAHQALRGMQSDRVQRAYMVAMEFVLTANQYLRDKSQELSDEGDFILHALRVISFTGPFRLQLSDANGASLSNTLIDYQAFTSAAGVGVPFPIIPELVFPRSSKISVSILDTSGAANTVRLLFQGVLVGRIQ
jgi:hypothetical protein